MAATYIILFTIYGAVLSLSGATRFFIELSFSAFGQSKAGPGRTVSLAGFLLGTVSGSGVATTVTPGGIAWPLLRRAGYPQENAGGLSAAAGIGAILSPPTLGAAAFIIAELLGVSYLQVLIWATVPTILYYPGINLAVEMDARRYHTHTVAASGRSAAPSRRVGPTGHRRTVRIERARKLPRSPYRASGCSGSVRTDASSCSPGSPPAPRA